MLKNKKFQISIGGIALLFSSVSLITHNLALLLLPIVQIILGFTTAGMINSGISSFQKKQKGWGFSFIFIALVLIAIIVSIHTFSIKGLIPVVILYSICAFPILIMALFDQRLENKYKL